MFHSGMFLVFFLFIFLLLFFLVLFLSAWIGGILTQNEIFLKMFLGCKNKFILIKVCHQLSEFCK